MATETSREVPGALAWGLVSKVLVSVLAMVTNVLVVRGLGEHDYGVYSIFINIARFLAIGISLALSQAMLQFLPEVRVKGNVRGARQLLFRTLVFQLGCWLVVLAIIYLLRGWISELQRVDLRQILLLGTALLIFEVLWTTAVHVFTAVRRMAQLTVVSIIQKAVQIAFLLALLDVGFTIPRVLYAVAGSFVIGLIVFAFGFRRSLHWMKGSAGPGLPTLRMMRYALPIALGGLINQILWRSSETLIIGHYWPPEVVGYFNAAYNLPQLILEFIPLAIWPIILASLSEVHSRRSEDLRRGIGLYFRLLFVLVLPVAMTGVVLGGQIYLALYSEKMAPGAPICQLLFAIFLFSFLVTPLRMALFVKERTMVNMWITVVGATVNVALDFVFIPRYGLWGAVPPVAIALVVSDILQYVVSRRILPGMGIPWRHLGRVLLGSSIVLPLWLLRDALGAPLFLGAALIGGTLAQYLALRALRVVGSEERELLLESNLPMKRLIADLLSPRR